ncbi:MAG: hypothetical protein VKM92_04565 [Cyanobacteriota bacterium]|nr:hypothetical protein [Cyanobacteriota bacterium]
MGANYTIYQQALDLQASGFDRYSSITIGIGLAKFMQILLPQVAFVATSLLLTPARLLPIARMVWRGRSRQTQLNKAEGWIREFQRLQGFFFWKLACDLGFFIIVTQYGSWLRALTLSGLLSYTAMQFIIYYLIGQRLIMANLVVINKKNRPKSIRTTWWKNLGSKLLYEEMGVTINQVNGRIIIIKMIIDYVAMWVTWSAYTAGFFLFANGGFGLASFYIFPHVSMSTLYLSVYLGYAAMFTIAEVALKNIAFRIQMPTWNRKLFLSTQFKQLVATFAITLILPLLIGTLTIGWKVIGENTSRIKGVVNEWRISLDGNAPQWNPNRAMKIDCGPSCLEEEFRKGPYTSENQ